MARDMATLIDSHLGEPLHVVGHSFGGHVALALSALRPRQLLTVCIEDIPLILDNSGHIAPRAAGSSGNRPALYIRMRRSCISR